MEPGDIHNIILAVLIVSIPEASPENYLVIIFQLS